VLLATWLGLTLTAGPGFADRVTDGERALKAGRLDQALEAFQAAAADGNARGQAGIGRVWLRRGRYEPAMEAFRRAATMDAAFHPVSCPINPVSTLSGFQETPPSSVL